MPVADSYVYISVHKVCSSLSQYVRTVHNVRVCSDILVHLPGGHVGRSMTLTVNMVQLKKHIVKRRRMNGAVADSSDSCGNSLNQGATEYSWHRCALSVCGCLVVFLLWQKYNELSLSNKSTLNMDTESHTANALRQSIWNRDWAQVREYALQSKNCSSHLQMAVAARAFSTINKLRELCAGCTTEEKFTDQDYRKGLYALMLCTHRDSDVVSALFAATRTRDSTAIHVITRKRPSAVNAPFSGTDSTRVLHIASSTSSELGFVSKALLNGDKEIISRLRQWLVSLDFNISTINSLTSNANEISAAQWRPVLSLWSTKFVTQLLKAGANMRVTDQLGRSPLHVAALVGNAQALDAMLSDVSLAQEDQQWFFSGLDLGRDTFYDLAALSGFESTNALLRNKWNMTQTERAIAHERWLRNTTSPDGHMDSRGRKCDGVYGSGWVCFPL